VAAPGGESVLLAVAAHLERARGWRRHAPAYDPSGRPAGAGGARICQAFRTRRCDCYRQAHPGRL